MRIPLSPLQKPAMSASDGRALALQRGLVRARTALPTAPAIAGPPRPPGTQPPVADSDPRVSHPFTGRQDRKKPFCDAHLATTWPFHPETHRSAGGSQPAAKRSEETMNPQIQQRANPAGVAPGERSPGLDPAPNASASHSPPRETELPELSTGWGAKARPRRLRPLRAGHRDRFAAPARSRVAAAGRAALALALALTLGVGAWAPPAVAQSNRPPSSQPEELPPPPPLIPSEPPRQNQPRRDFEGNLIPHNMIYTAPTPADNEDSTEDN